MSNLYFPQLAIGSLAQYPITRSWSKTTSIDTLPDGSTVRMSSVCPARLSWELRYTGLSAAEWVALQTLFNVSQGRFGAFTFLDPTDNLLSWSEDFTQGVWNADPLMQISAGAPDPLGGTGGTKLTNGAQTTQSVMQSLAGPSWFQYCVSVYLRSDVPSTVSLVRTSTSNQQRQTIAVGQEWTRALASGILGGQDDGVRFGLEVAAGTSVYAFGAQVEAQPGAGAYRAKTNRSGVYSKSRFDQDALAQAAGTVGQFSTTLRITSTY
jgi:hypothetical protein